MAVSRTIAWSIAGIAVVALAALGLKTYQARNDERAGAGPGQSKPVPGANRGIHRMTGDENAAASRKAIQTADSYFGIWKVTRFEEKNGIVRVDFQSLALDDKNGNGGCLSLGGSPNNLHLPMGIRRGSKVRFVYRDAIPIEPSSNYMSYIGFQLVP